MCPLYRKFGDPEFRRIKLATGLEEWPQEDGGKILNSWQSLEQPHCGGQGFPQKYMFSCHVECSSGHFGTAAPQDWSVHIKVRDS